MMRLQRLVAFLLLFGSTSGVLCAEEMSNQYGQFVATKVKDDYSVAFVLDPTNVKFKKVRNVEMFDYGNDEEGDISVVVYKKGDKEVFFRNRRNYWRYVLRNTATTNVCGNDWSPKIVYREKTEKWECSKMNYPYRTYMWWQIDQGLREAKREEWVALAERILKNVERIKK